MRRSLVIVISALALAGAACGSNSGSGSTGPASTTGGATTGAGECTAATAKHLSGGKLTILNFAYVPDCFIASSGSSFAVSNKDPVAHTFTVTGTDLNVTIEGSEAKSADLSSLAPGTYPFMCTIHPAMTGTLIVT
jgi:plastocyanin